MSQREGQEEESEYEAGIGSCALLVLLFGWLAVIPMYLFDGVIAAVSSVLFTSSISVLVIWFEWLFLTVLVSEFEIHFGGDGTGDKPTVRGTLKRISQAHTYGIQYLLSSIAAGVGLIVMGFAMAYHAVPYSTEISDQVLEGIKFSDSVYFSFVTFSTIGYGDIHPHGFGRVLSILEYVSGLFFEILVLALSISFVGRIASDWIT
jgi:hypothetical protein